MYHKTSNKCLYFSFLSVVLFFLRFCITSAESQFALCLKERLGTLSGCKYLSSLCEMTSFCHYSEEYYCHNWTIDYSEDICTKCGCTSMLLEYIASGKSPYIDEHDLTIAKNILRNDFWCGKFHEYLSLFSYKSISNNTIGLFYAALEEKNIEKLRLELKMFNYWVLISKSGKDEYELIHSNHLHFIQAKEIFFPGKKLSCQLKSFLDEINFHLNSNDYYLHSFEKIDGVMTMTVDRYKNPVIEILKESLFADENKQKLLQIGCDVLDHEFTIQRSGDEYYFWQSWVEEYTLPQYISGDKIHTKCRKGGEKWSKGEIENFFEEFDYIIKNYGNAKDNVNYAQKFQDFHEKYFCVTKMYDMNRLTRFRKIDYKLVDFEEENCDKVLDKMNLPSEDKIFTKIFNKPQEKVFDWKKDEQKRIESYMKQAKGIIVVKERCVKNVYCKDDLLRVYHALWEETPLETKLAETTIQYVIIKITDMFDIFEINKILAGKGSTPKISNNMAFSILGVNNKGEWKITNQVPYKTFIIKKK